MRAGPLGSRTFSVGRLATLTCCLPRAHRCHIGSKTWHTSPTSAPGLGSPMPHMQPGLGSPVPYLHREWAHPAHICAGSALDINTGTGLTRATSAPGLGSPPGASAPGLGSPVPHLHRDWAHPGHICTGTGLGWRCAASCTRPALPAFETAAEVVTFDIGKEHAAEWLQVW